MIIHPDGRLEGTPEELAAYQKAMQGTKPDVIEKPVYIPYPVPEKEETPKRWFWPGDIVITSGQVDIKDGAHYLVF